VTFGGSPATSFSVVSSTEIDAVAPPGALGPADVVVTTSAGASTTSAADRFTYTPDVPGAPSAVTAVPGATTGPVATVLRVVRPAMVCAPVSISRVCLAAARSREVVLVPAGIGWRGDLLLRTSRGRPVAAAAVQMIDGARSITVHTDRSGSASYRVAAGGDRTISFAFLGSSAGQASSASVEVRDRPAATLGLVPGVGGPGKILLAGVAVNGTGARAGERVVVQLWRSRRWITVAIARATPGNGWWNATIHRPSRGLGRVRTVIGGIPSVPVTIRLR
jgi:hypothetical protein